MVITVQCMLYIIDIVCESLCVSYIYSIYTVYILYIYSIYMQSIEPAQFVNQADIQH